MFSTIALTSCSISNKKVRRSSIYLCTSVYTLQNCLSHDRQGGWASNACRKCSVCALFSDRPTFPSFSAIPFISRGKAIGLVTGELQVYLMTIWADLGIIYSLEHEDYVHPCELNESGGWKEWRPAAWPRLPLDRDVFLLWFRKTNSSAPVSLSLGSPAETKEHQTFHSL